MKERLPYSFEFDELDKLAGGTLPAKLESLIAPLGIQKYMSELHERLVDDNSYKRILSISEDIMDAGLESDVSSGFVDGAAVAIDFTHVFMPRLAPLLDGKLEATLDRQAKRAQAFVPFTSLSFKKRFVTSLLADGRMHYRQYYMGHTDMIDQIQRIRHYDVAGYSAVLEGFGFMMERTTAAYQSDLVKAEEYHTDFAREADRAMQTSKNPDTISPQSPALLTPFDFAVQAFFEAEAARNQ